MAEWQTKEASHTFHDNADILAVLSDSGKLSLLSLPGAAPRSGRGPYSYTLVSLAQMPVCAPKVQSFVGLHLV